MGVNYVGCFHLPKKSVVESRLKAFLNQYQLQYEDRHAFFQFDEEGTLWDSSEAIGEKLVNWAQFIQEVNDLNCYPKGLITQNPFDFEIELGFVTVGTQRFCFLDLTCGNLDVLVKFLAERNSNLLQFLISLHQCLEANAMVWGVDVLYEESLAFINGTMGKKHIGGICATVGGARQSLEWFREFRGRDVFIHDIPVVAGLFPGFEEFPRDQTN